MIAVIESYLACELEIMKADQTPVEMMYTKCLQNAYDYFNTVFFNDSLQQCLITLQRRKNVAGYFARDRFATMKNGQVVHELSLNPEFFHKPVEVLQTLAHEMAHVKEFQDGTSSRNGYHNKQWSKIMVEEIGLLPVCYDTGAKENQLTGFKMGDKIISGGKFEAAVKELFESGFEIAFCDFVKYSKNITTEISDTVEVGEEETEQEPQPVKPKTREKFTCPCCGANAWGKPDLKLICEPCSDLESDEIKIIRYVVGTSKPRENIRG